jgi:prepilin-type N-terminal cleavage/methylation domain-containing protein
MEDLPQAKILPDAVKALNKKGFTLIEVVVATLLLAVLAAGVAGAFWGSQHFLSRAKHRVQAFNFAIAALDRLRSNYKYLDGEMNVGSGYLALDIGCSVTGEMAAMAPLPADFTYDVTEPQVNGYKQVTVKVDWNEPSLQD